MVLHVYIAIQLSVMEKVISCKYSGIDRPQKSRYGVLQRDSAFQNNSEFRHKILHRNMLQSINSIHFRMIQSSNRRFSIEVYSANSAKNDAQREEDR
jgi:hypothetical protein